jgi:AcrR family transcriptional regulator
LNRGGRREASVFTTRFDYIRPAEFPTTAVLLSKARYIVQAGLRMLKSRRRGGRPNRVESGALERRLIEAAAALFAEHGFDATSVDSVAERAGVSKATIYTRYDDKAQLFAAVVRRQISELFENLDFDETQGDASEVLLEVGRQALKLVLKPETTAIYRMVIAQTPRFPELGILMDREGFQRGQGAIARLLRKLSERGEVETDDFDMAAEMFLSLVIGRLSRLALLGLASDNERIEFGLSTAVRLFLEGVQSPGQS